MCNDPSQDPALARLRAQVLVRWDAFPRLDELDALLSDALARACVETPKVITLTSPVSRPARLRLAAIGGRADLDSFYHGESVELCVNEDGRLFLVYWRSDGGDYAIEWSSATLIPEQLMRDLPAVLAMAMFDGQD